MHHPDDQAAGRAASAVGSRPGPAEGEAAAVVPALRRRHEVIPGAATETSAPGLTSRQRAVVALLAGDASDDEAAEMLGISVRTLRADIADLKRALGVSSRFAAALELGRRQGAHGSPRTLSGPASPTGTAAGGGSKIDGRDKDDAPPSRGRGR